MLSLCKVVRHCVMECNVILENRVFTEILLTVVVDDSIASAKDSSWSFNSCCKIW